MYKVINVGGQLVGGQWRWDDLTIRVPPNPDDGGVYIQCAHAGKDNPNLSAYYDTVVGEGLRAGFYIVLEDGDVSYAKQILSLIQWYKGGRKLGLPPAIVFAGSDKTPHVIRGDFEAYFKQFIIDVPEIPYVVLGYNTSSLKQILEPDGDDITNFKNLITGPKTRLWMFQYGDKYPSWIGPYKSVWMWGNATHQNIVDYAPPVAPPPVVVEEPVISTDVPSCIYQLVIDTWEGQITVDESLLKSKGVKGIITRINDMNGGHHMDTGFQKQWEESAGFQRAPYFVYNPWVSGEENFDWLFKHTPPEAKKVMSDVEVKYILKTPTKYGAELAKFMDLATQNWSVDTYTGQWFISTVSPWPGGNYWWARYPYTLYPDSRMEITWEDMIVKLNATPWNPGIAPGPVKLWQCTADRYILPGCGGRPIDINLFKGSYAELQAWFGDVPTTELTFDEKFMRLWNAHPELH